MPRGGDSHCILCFSFQVMAKEEERRATCSSFEAVWGWWWTWGGTWYAGLTPYGLFIHDTRDAQQFLFNKAILFFHSTLVRVFWKVKIRHRLVTSLFHSWFSRGDLRFNTHLVTQWEQLESSLYFIIVYLFVNHIFIILCK